MRHLDRESDPRVGMPRRRNQQGHLGIAAEPKCAAAEEGSVIAESNRRLPSLDTGRLRHDAGIKISWRSVGLASNPKSPFDMDRWVKHDRRLSASPLTAEVLTEEQTSLAVLARRLESNPGQVVGPERRVCSKNSSQGLVPTMIARPSYRKEDKHTSASQKTIQGFIEHSVDENRRQSGRREREARPSKMGWLGIFLATRLGLCTAACRRSESRFCGFPYSLPNPRIRACHGAGRPHSAGLSLSGERAAAPRPHPEAGETSKCGVWSAGQQAEVGPKESLTVTLDSGHGELAGRTRRTPARELRSPVRLLSSALLGGEGDCCHSQTCVGKAERCMFPSLRLTPQ